MPKQRANAVEGRATSARPSLCLLAAFFAIALLGDAPVARAETPKELTLSGTSPRSTLTEPANSVTPRVIGSEEEIIKSVVRFGPTRPIAAVGNPANVVKIFTNSECDGAPVATGTYSELDGEGIQVEVVADSETTFYADQAEPADLEHPSPCSKKGVTYYESSTIVMPPEEPPAGGGESPGRIPRPSVSPNAPVAPRIHTLPGGRANDNTPRILGSAPGADSLKLFSNVGCAGAPLAVVPPDELTAGVVVHVSDNSVTDFTAVAVANGRQSFCSPAATYVEDSTPPHVRITMGPGIKTRRHKAVFRFDATGEEEPIGTSFRCRVNHGKWRSCHSPFKLEHLHFRRYVLRVRATDDVGNTSVRPAKRSFKVIH